MSYANFLGLMRVALGKQTAHAPEVRRWRDSKMPIGVATLIDKSGTPVAIAALSERFDDLSDMDYLDFYAFRTGVATHIHLVYSRDDVRTAALRNVGDDRLTLSSIQFTPSENADSPSDEPDSEGIDFEAIRGDLRFDRRSLSPEIRTLEQKRVELNVIIGERDAEIERLEARVDRLNALIAKITEAYYDAGRLVRVFSESAHPPDPL